MHLNVPFMGGQPVVCMFQGFDAESFCRNVERFKVTLLMLAPPIILTLSLYPSKDRRVGYWFSCVLIILP